jgi:predicted SAM-dependent methyltransferase
VKLHLGCGKKLWPGFVNVDLFGEPDVRSDLRTLPFDDGVADEIHSIHTVEHFYLHEVAGVLREWRRVLKPGGVIALELPCRDNVFRFIREGVKDPALTIYPMFSPPGTVATEYDLHKWLWSRDELAALLLTCGFVDVRFEKPQFHVPARDMRVIGVRGVD